MAVDWFPYFLHPERVQQDFPTGQAHTLSDEQRLAAVDILQGLFSSSNFREYIISAYPGLRDGPGATSGKYLGPTPPSTPTSDSFLDTTQAAAAGEGGRSLRRHGQCSAVVTDDAGMPAESLGAALQRAGMAALSQRQERLLMVAHRLSLAVGFFSAEEVERAVHATLRFVYYMHVLENTAEGKEAQRRAELGFRRWWVRAAYREEEAGLALEVERSARMDAHLRALQ
ncbi:hypothetical protein LPJ66_010787, partial [Kickxella alabastrina]